MTERIRGLKSHFLKEEKEKRMEGRRAEADQTRGNRLERAHTCKSASLSRKEHPTREVEDAKGKPTKRVKRSCGAIHP